MALPKRKTSKAKHASKQAHHAYTIPNLSACPQCHAPKPSHQVCPACGSYKGRDVSKTKDDSR